MKEFAEYVIKNLIDSPEELNITEVVGDSTLILEVRLAKKDIGKIVGKKGKTIDAIRTLLHSIASKNHLRVVLQIIE